jgi:hypothetical protein
MVWGSKGRDIPAGSFTLDKSQSASVFLNSSYMPTGRSCLGMSAAIESSFCVGAAKRAAGASAKIRLSDVEKIIFGCGVGAGEGLVDVVLCLCVTVDPKNPS